VGNVSRQGGRGELAAGENKSRRIGFSEKNKPFIPRFEVRLKLGIEPIRFN
jgi:hypothetical protein